MDWACLLRASYAERARTRCCTRRERTAGQQLVLLQLATVDRRDGRVRGWPREVLHNAADRCVGASKISCSCFDGIIEFCPVNDRMA